VVDNEVEDESDVSVVAFLDELLHVGNSAVWSIYFFIFTIVRNWSI